MSKYAVVDLEMCRVPKERRSSEYHWSQETIQIGAVLLDEELEIKEGFCTYVSPKYGVVDPFIRNLTGIREKDVAGSPEMAQALQRFLKWLPEEALLVSWSDSDKSQIQHEIEAKGILIPDMEKFMNRWIDCQALFAEKMGEQRNYNLTEALIAADISFNEHVHDGLVDAANTALLFAKMKKEPELQLNRYYARARRDETEHLHVTLGSLLQNLGGSSSA